jgi:hypothetical protein
MENKEKEKTSLVKSQSKKGSQVGKTPERLPSVIDQQTGLRFRGGSTLLGYCEDPEALRKILSEGLYGALSLFSGDTGIDAVKVMMADIIEDYKYDDVSVIIEAIKDIRKGKRKIYGKVTPFDLREIITAKLEEMADMREGQHNEIKGHGDVEVRTRTCGRISEHVQKKIEYRGKMKRSK